jgi:ABC-type multidrug transport system fused ATPase/permease subunit
MASSWWRRWWLIDAGAIVRAGRKRPLAFEDAPPLPELLEPRAASAAFDALSPEHYGRFIVRAFFTTRAPAWRLCALTLARQVLALSTPLLLHAVLERLPGAASQLRYPSGLVALCACFGLAGILSGVATQHWFQQALTVRTILVNAVNRRVVAHALKLRRAARARMETGDLVNHLGSDTDALAEAGFFLPEGVNAALSIAVAFVTLSAYLGWAALASTAALLLLAPLTRALARRYRALDDRIMSIRDERATLMSQILHGIRVVKYHAWEASSWSEVQAVRGREVATRMRLVGADLVSSAIWVSTSTIVAFAGLGTYVWLGGALTAPLVFACLVLFQMMEEPFGLVPHILARAQHARVAAARLHAYYSAEERPEDERPLSPPGQALALQVEHVSVRYEGAEVCALEDASFHVAEGSALAIVGPVGAGKSTLARVLAGIEAPSAGRVVYGSELRPRIAYVPQEAFILNANMRENIVFGGVEEAEGASTRELAAIVADCALEPDLAAMPSGLETEIGERGVNLSGGQKQRVALARAAYHRPGLVVLDDPLSAVDVHTEDALVVRLLFGRLRDVTRVVVTHRLAHLQRFDRVVFVVAGQIEAQGSYAELMRDHAGFRAFAASTARADQQLLGASPAALEGGKHAELPASMARVTEDEDRETGAVRYPVYRDYVRAMVGTRRVIAPLLLSALVLSALIVGVFPALQRIWFARFTEGRIATSPMSAVIVYGGLGALALVVALCQRSLWLLRATFAGRSLHDQALRGVLAAPLRFFDSTPTGRILNRFARDLEAVDDELSWALEQCFRSLAQTFTALVLIVGIAPVILVLAVPVLAMYYVVQRDYRTAGREAKRLESIARSPRYAHFKELVSGLDVIHGFGRERLFMDRFYVILGQYQRVFWCNVQLNRWFGIRVALVGGSVAFGTSITVALLARNSAISPGMAGLALTYAMGLWGSLNWTVRAMSEVEARMTSAERLQHYARLPSEPITRGDPLPEKSAWPVRGELELRDVAVRYAAHLPRVLDGVSFRVEAGTKVGIIGRTGAGKSTLIQALFRFVETEQGAILIDGIDIARVPLPRLRRALAVIPQDPTLFAGSIRSNLDRFRAYDDDALWTALRRVHLDALIRSLPRQLDAAVSEHGNNFSQGQRQLLCMARAILTRARIVVLDEATASVDLRTDERIQQTVRSELKGVTVLVIAHRLDTVADAGLILELASGRVVASNARAAPAAHAEARSADPA